MISYVCKYTPIELFAGFGQTCQVLDDMPGDFERSDEVAHANLCGFGKAVIQQALAGGARELVLVNCCDVMRRAFDVVGERTTAGFVHLLDLPHTCGPCQVSSLARGLQQLCRAYEQHSGIGFDLAACQAAFGQPGQPQGDYIGIMGVRVGRQLEHLIAHTFALPVSNLTCTGNRCLNMDPAALCTTDEHEFFQAYAQALLSQLPCRRMHDASGRRALFEDPHLRGIVYHTMKFCDYYEPEFAQLATQASQTGMPLLKIESDFTRQSIEQLRTRIQAFAEAIEPQRVRGAKVGERTPSHATGARRFVAGIDSGSTSTDVVIMAGDGSIVASRIVPTGAGAQMSAEACLQQALDAAGLARGDIERVVTTGYGRAYIDAGDGSATEITCHARGAHHLDPRARTIIDIGGQDSKVIRVDEQGRVASFVMNDKCAAGTGRFLEMMARALQIDLDEMSTMGTTCDEQIVISSMCSVFAESEVVSLVAQNKALPDIVHGIDDSVAAKVATLVHRVQGAAPFMITGGVAQNAGVVAAIERKLGQNVIVPAEAQLCGAIGAALIAMDSR